VLVEEEFSRLAKKRWYVQGIRAACNQLRHSRTVLGHRAPMWRNLGYGYTQDGLHIQQGNI